MRNLELAYLTVAYGMAGIMFHATKHRSFSTVSHIAIDRKLTRYVFFWGLTISALIFAMLMFGWAIPYYNLNLTIQFLVGFIVVCQILTGLFPINEKKFGGAHTIFASSLGLGMFLLLVALAATTTLHAVARTADALLAVGMIGLLATSLQVPRGEYLFHEKIFFAFWHAAIFITIYFG